MKEINTELSKNMVGVEVTHKTLGRGVVTFCTNVSMKVKFAEREMAFGFPYAFKDFLKVDDENLQKEIENFYDTGAWVEPIHDHCED